MNEVNLHTPPQEGKADKALAIVKALLGDIVPFGGTFAELAGKFIRTPYQKRAEEWQTQLGETLNRLESKLKLLSASQARTLEDLQDDPAFVDTVLHATQVALRTASEDKRTALRNSIINSGLPLAPDESQRQMFLNMIESFTSWHLRLLTLFNAPENWFVKHGRKAPSFGFSTSLSKLLEIAYPELVGHCDFYDQVWAELRSAGVVNTESLHGMLSMTGVFAQRTSGLGQKLVTFISEPYIAGSVFDA